MLDGADQVVLIDFGPAQTLVLAFDAYGVRLEPVVVTAWFDLCMYHSN